METKLSKARGNVVSLRITDEEKCFLQKTTRLHNISVSEILREGCFAF
jgi:hypothetical protein